MSYATGTTHYNLPQTVGSDKRDWSDTNQAFADIDAAIYDAVEDSGTALTAAQAAQTTADSAATDAASAVTTANAASASAASAAETAALARTEAQSAVNTANTASSTATSAQATATNADTVALAAQTNIGTMSNLQTTDKTSLVAAINEVLSQIGGAMPTLNFSTPLNTFDASHLTYTAVKECYLMGCLYAGSSGGTPTLSINNIEVAHAPNNSGLFISPLKLNVGDVVTVSQADARLHVYEELSS